MADDKLVPSGAPGTNGGSPLVPGSPIGVPQGWAGAAPFAMEEAEEGGVDLKQYLAAVSAAEVAAGRRVRDRHRDASFLWTHVQVQYTAVGNLWVQKDPGRQAGAGDVEPIRTSGLFEANAWIELLRSYAVLDSVVIEEKLS